MWTPEDRSGTQRNTAAILRPRGHEAWAPPPWRACSREAAATGTGLGLPHFPPKIKRAIYLHMVGAPPQMDLFDYKPKMKDWYDKDLPESIRKGQRLTTMTSGQSRFPIAPSVFKFAQHGQVGRMDLRTAAERREDGGRSRHHPVHAHRGDQSRARDHVHPDGQS